MLRFTGPGELLALGHPRQGNLPENLPLIRSSDHGETFEVVQGTAEADYHELEIAGDRIFAVNVESPDIQVVQRRRQDVADAARRPTLPIDVVVNPDDPDHWAVSTEQGTFVSTNGGQSWRPRDTTFGARLAWPATDALYSVDRNGKLRVSADGGEQLEGPRRRRRAPERNYNFWTKRRAARGDRRREDPKVHGWRQDVDHGGHLALTRHGLHE